MNKLDIENLASTKEAEARNSRLQRDAFLREAKSIEKRIEDAKKTLAEFQSNIKKFKATQEQLAGEIEVLRREKQETLSCINALKASLEPQIKQLEADKKYIDLKEAQVANSKVLISKTVSDYENKIKELEKKRLELVAAEAVTKRSAEVHVAETLKAKQLQETLTQSIRSYEGMANALLDQQVALNAKKAELEEAKTALNNQAALLDKELNDLIDKRKKLQSIESMLEIQRQNKIKLVEKERELEYKQKALAVEENKLLIKDMRLQKLAYEKGIKDELQQLEAELAKINNPTA